MNDKAKPVGNDAKTKEEKKRTLIRIGIVASVVAIILGVFIWYMWFYVPMEKYLAKKLCDCTRDSGVQASTLVLSNDDFKYRIGLESCIGTEFAAYESSMSEDEKHYYLEQFQTEVFNQCALDLSKVFAPIPRPPRIMRDTLIPTAINN